MNWNAANLANLRRLFSEGFTALDVAEPLVSFDGTTAAAEALRVMTARDFDLVGVRRDGCVIGYIEKKDCGEGTCAEYVRSIDEAAVISDATSLADVVVSLSQQPRVFVQTLGAVGGIVTISDLQKPPVRMWLFGMITLVEMRMSSLVEQLCEGESWTAFLSEGRLQKAATLLEERRRRRQNLQLIDCLQFSDKATIIARNEAIRSLTRFTSRRQVEENCAALENLRNNLAHSQDIVASDWDTVVMLSKELDGVIGGTREVQNALAGKPDTETPKP